MESFSTRQLAVIAAGNKDVWWIFRVQTPAGTVYYWSTGSMASSGNETVNSGAIEAPGVWTDNEWERYEAFKIVNFSGITMRRSKSEAGIHAPNDVSFTIVNGSNTLTASDFTGGTVRIGLVIADATGKELCGSWRFRIKSASPHNQQIDVVCEDFMQQYMKGSYPNTRLLSDIFPNVLGTASDNVCVPEPYGTCYIPLRSVYAVDGRYYLLGDTTNTYTITAVRSPREVGTKIEWTSAGGFAFTQSTKADAAATDWRVFQPIIADSDNDGTVDACGLWLSGSKILDMPTKFSRSDTASITDPAEIIRRVLRNMGLADTDLNISSFATATTTFASWGLAWNFAFWYKENRPVVLARLLAMCHCALIVGEQISLQVLSKTSQATITDAEVLKMQEVGPSTFLYTDALAERNSDSGYAAFAKSGESQDEFIKLRVPAKTTTAVTDAEVITFPGVSDTQQVQKLGTLYFQRKFLKSADISFTGKGTLLALRPDDVITISYADFGGTYDVLIDEMTINPDVSISFACLKFSAALDDWADLAPGAITIATDTPTTVFTPVISGPDGGTPTTGSPANALPDRIRIGTGTNYIVLDPNTPLRISVYAADVEVMRFGNLNGFLGYVAALYGIAIGDATNYLKYDPTNGLRLSGAISVGGSISQDFVVGNDDDVQSTGTLLDEDGFQTWGFNNSFGGAIVSSDGNYMTCIGKRLTATGKTKQYPLNNGTNYSSSGDINLYAWSGTAWVELFQGGVIDSALVMGGETSGTYLKPAAYFSHSNGGTGVKSLGVQGVHGVGTGGSGYNWGGKFEGDAAPVVLVPSGSASAPSHSAPHGSLWVTSDAVLYINNGGGTTWQKVGAQ